MTECNMSCIGDMLDIEISYVDHVSTSHARRWIDDNISNVNNITLHRSYSTANVERALLTLYNDDIDVHLQADSILVSEDF